jgi:hypothetical protein
MTRLRGNDVGLLDNKDRFYRFCIDNHLPTIQVLDLSNPDELAKMGSRDLFVKAILGHSGKGCYLVPWDADKKAWILNGETVARDELQLALDTIYEGERYIVCYRYRNHPGMQWISRRVLTTVRIVSVWNQEGEPDLLRATLRIPSRPEAILDNSSQGGISAPVDPATGIIYNTAKSWEEDFETDKFPGTDKSLIGYQIPLWDDLTDTVKRAHVVADNYNFIGWDVAISEDGVLLSECNVWSDIELVQAPQRTPFLSSDVVGYFLLEKCLWEKE